MWKAGLAGALVALLTIATFLAIGCTTILGPAICSVDRTRSGLSAVTTVKTPARHAHYVRDGAPPAYRGQRNPFKATIGNVVEGARLYDLRCAVCHGVMGVGDGDGGKTLDVPPADLGASLAQPLYRDDFFYWTISDGGALRDRHAAVQERSHGTREMEDPHLRACGVRRQQRRGNASPVIRPSRADQCNRKAEARAAVDGARTQRPFDCASRSILLRCKRRFSI